MPTTLATTLRNIVDKVPNTVNTSLLHELHLYMKDCGTSERHQNNTLKVMILYARYLGYDLNFFQIQHKEQITNFLDTKIKTISEDPDKRWITTWNHYLVHIKYFFRWLHNHKMRTASKPQLVDSSYEWQTPPFAQIRKKKTKRLSPYSESEIWELEELKTIIKYEPSKRNKAAIALMWDLNARNHELVLLKLKNIRMRERYADGEIPHQAKTGSGPILLTFSFPYVRDWLNEHPFGNTPDARLICNLNNGAPVKPEALWTLMKQLKSRIRRLVDSGAITDESEREKLRVILTTKKFNPYCFRHSSISHDSDFLPDYALKKKVRWSMNSKQPSRYIKTRLSDNLKNTILVHSGIISEKEGNPRPVILECGRCGTICSIHSKYCVTCSYPLTPSAFDEIKEQEDSKFRSLEARFNELQSRVEEIITGLGRMTDQQQINVMAKSLFSSGMLKMNSNK